MLVSRDGISQIVCIRVDVDYQVSCSHRKQRHHHTLWPEHHHQSDSRRHNILLPRLVRRAIKIFVSNAPKQKAATTYLGTMRTVRPPPYVVLIRWCYAYVARYGHRARK